MHSATQDVQEVNSRLARRVGVRGLVAIAFGIVMLVWPRPTLVALTYVFGVMAAIDGLLAVREALTATQGAERWWRGFVGLAGIGAAAAVFLWPAITALALLYVIGMWVLLTGAAEVTGALLDRGIGDRRHGLALHGLISVAFGVTMLARPEAGALVLVALIAACVIARGVTLCGIAADLRRGDDVATPAVPREVHASAA